MGDQSACRMIKLNEKIEENGSGKKALQQPAGTTFAFQVL